MAAAELHGLLEKQCLEAVYMYAACQLCPAEKCYCSKSIHCRISLGVTNDP